MKVFTTILNKRIESFCEANATISDAQFGFRKGCSTVDAIYILISIVQKYINENKRKDSFKKQLTEVTSNYLSIVFHRFMERDKSPLQIRINNVRLSPFNPFPTSISDFRSIESKQRTIEKDYVKIEGFVLPARCIDESKNSVNDWAASLTTPALK